MKGIAMSNLNAYWPGWKKDLSARLQITHAHIADPTKSDPTAPVSPCNLDNPRVVLKDAADYGHIILCNQHTILLCLSHILENIERNCNDGQETESEAQSDD